MSWSATTATQSDIRTCFGAIEDERFYSFLYEGTATPQENQRIETRHAGASKQAFCARLPQIFTLCSYKIDVFLRIFSWTPQSSLPPQDWCFVPGFRQFSSHVTKCHACNGICTLSSLDAALTMRYAKNTYHDTTKLLRLPCQMMMEVSKAAPATKNGSHLLKATQKYCARHTEKLLARYETCSGKSQSATPAIRNEVTQGLKPPKYERLRSVADAKVTSSEHTLNLQTPRARREPCYACGKMRIRTIYCYFQCWLTCLLGTHIDQAGTFFHRCQSDAICPFFPQLALLLDSFLNPAPL